MLEGMKEKLRCVLEEYGVVRAGIFGSHVRGEQSENSDVDVLVELDEGFDLIEFIKIKNLLEEAVEMKVDLVEYENIRDELRESILKEEVRII